MLTNSQEEINSAFDDDCVTCCCVGCSALGYAFCCKRMRRSVRIRLFLVYLNIFCVLFAVLTGAIFYGSNKTLFTSTDMRIVRDRLSYLFCDKVEVDSRTESGDSFSAFIMDSEPHVDINLKQTYHAEVTKFIMEDSHLQHQFFLLTGSVIDVSVCVDTFVQMYIIRGKRNFNDFIDNDYMCDNCFEKSLNFYKSQCTKPSDFVSSRFHVSETDEYFIVYTSPNDDAWLTSKYNVTRTLYDVSSARQSYSSVFHCEFLFQLKDSYVVLHAGFSNTLDPYNVKTSCSPRVSFYFVVFFAIPYLIGIVICILIHKFGEDPDETQSSAEAGLRNSLSNNSNFVNYQSTAPCVLTPPKYEDIIRSDIPGPPSYDEAIGSINNST